MKKTITLLTALCSLAGCTSTPTADHGEKHGLLGVDVIKIPESDSSRDARLEAEAKKQAHNAEVERLAAKTDWAQKNNGRVIGFTSSLELYEHMSEVKKLVSIDSAVETKFCDVDYQYAHALLQHVRYGSDHRKYMKAELEWKQCKELQKKIGKYYPSNGEYLSGAYGFTLVEGCDMDKNWQDPKAKAEWSEGGICSDALNKAKARIRGIRQNELKALENLPPLRLAPEPAPVAS